MECARIRSAELTRSEHLHAWHAEWLQLYQEGLSYADIGRRYGVSRTTVGRAVRPRLERP
ncbi:helix-turn-helix domain-containing protein [Arthrobacter sp. H14]|uniref:helix-turn-helix domain-containing protein n=1 Tax=Arthrobacter sp. H14 TaxID=1312959 RepID=UPI00047A1CE4|nr:helix-turn-helix domain-containing protein [Arthrobacter sp. H14]